MSMMEEREMDMNVDGLRGAIAKAEWQGVTWNGNPLAPVVCQDRLAEHYMTQLHDARDSVIAFLSAPLPYVCKSCDRDVRKIHPDFRGRKMNGHMGHLEMDPVTGATVLMDEGR